MWKSFVKEYLSVSKKERNGILIMLGIILLSVLSLCMYPYFMQPVKYDHSEFEKEITTLKITAADSINRFIKKTGDDADSYQSFSQPYENRYQPNKEWAGELFYFDPNTLDQEGWQRLGIRDKTIATIKNYLSKGGKFYKPEDIKKIWGMDETICDKLVPYIRIERKEYAAGKNDDYNKPLYEKKKYNPAVIDINTADTTALIALPGIGSKLAQRIISFRDKLGGFYTIEQVGETFGLADSTFQKIKPRLQLNNNPVKQLNINTATLDELKAHPYIRYGIGNAIVQYRNQHGNFSSLNDLKNIVLVTDEVYNKLLPYIAL